ncbi:DoxX family protein [Flavobacteriaceae bacterium]|nr:DoxX family protein [Flavobacteriaceae bacterium]
MLPSKIALFFILLFFSIVFIQSGLDKLFDKKGNISFLIELLGKVFKRPLILLAFYAVTVLEILSGLLCFVGVIEILFKGTSKAGLIGMILGSTALLVLLFGQRVSKNYEGAKTITIYFILAMMGLALL